MLVNSGMIFSSPRPGNPAGGRSAILPVFLPFAGCRTRCLYCAQTAQTGQPETPVSSLEAAWYQLDALLAERRRAGATPVEVAFYGGTFTALPGDWPDRFIRLAMSYAIDGGEQDAPGNASCGGTKGDGQAQRGGVVGVRCSTRPDAVDPALLSRLAGQGLRTVELGVQSFDDAVLRTSLRGYGGAQAEAACRMVQHAGLTLGIQLLPGLPGHTPSMLADDMERARALAPAHMRLYPCVVVRGTGLARMYTRGDYVPWSLDVAADACANALLAAWERGIPVIRVGLAQEPGLTDHVLAGPYHPSFGTMARGRALQLFLTRKLAEFGRPPRLLMAPQSVRGEFWGVKGECKAGYAVMGLTPDHVRWWHEPHFLLE